MTTLEQVIYYVQLLCIQYKTLPKATGTVQALATEVVADQIYNQVLNAFNLDTAIGAQLTSIGEYVGAPRAIFSYNPSIPYMAFWGYSDTPLANTGFAEYADTTDPVDYWIQYTTSETSFVLTDGTLRSLIQYLIALHANEHTVYTIDVLLDSFFGQYCTLTDNMDMSLTYTHLSTDPNQLFGIVNQLNLLPQPAGVSVSVVTI